MKVGTFLQISPKIKDFIQAKKPAEMEFAFLQEDDEDSYPFEDLDALVCNRVPYESISALNKPLLVQIPWSGVDAIDFQFFKSEPRLTLCNSHAHADAVAEHVWGLLLDAAKKISWNDAALRLGDWSGRGDSDGYSQRLRGKTLLIVGLGSIGARVSRFGHAFGMKVIGVKRHPTVIATNGEARTVLGHTQLETALASADFVVLSVPLTPETKNLFGFFNLSRMKPSAVLVSVARSGVINFPALYERLSQKKLAAAAIDNWPRERMTAKPEMFQEEPFHQLPNVVMSPHRAFRVEESGFDQWEDILENLTRVMEGKNPRNVVDLELQY